MMMNKTQGKINEPIGLDSLQNFVDDDISDSTFRGHEIDMHSYKDVVT